MSWFGSLLGAWLVNWSHVLNRNNLLLMNFVIEWILNQFETTFFILVSRIFKWHDDGIISRHHIFIWSLFFLGINHWLVFFWVLFVFRFLFLIIFVGIIIFHFILDELVFRVNTEEFSMSETSEGCLVVRNVILQIKISILWCNTLVTEKGHHTSGQKEHRRDSCPNIAHSFILLPSKSWSLVRFWSTVYTRLFWIRLTRFGRWLALLLSDILNVEIFFIYFSFRSLADGLFGLLLLILLLPSLILTLLWFVVCWQIIWRHGFSIWFKLVFSLIWLLLIDTCHLWN